MNSPGTDELIKTRVELGIFVRILLGLEFLPDTSESKLRVLSRVGAPFNVRLTCVTTYTLSFRHAAFTRKCADE